MELQELFIRLTVSFFALLLLTMFMGRKEISQLTLFNFVSAMAIGTLGGSLIIDHSLSIRNGILALVGWTLLTLLIGYIDMKSRAFRKFIDGDPVIVIKQGRIMERALRKVQLDVDSLRAMLREKDVFSLTDVKFAIFEVDGTLSVMKNESIQTNRSNLKDKQEDTHFPVPTEVISDGIVNTNNLSKLNLDKKWLHRQLQQSGVHSVSEVFYAEVQQDGSLYIDKRQDFVP
ncbi:Uncharacterized membrane protein YcaP, DUF421 family [Mesobacillus persicus]|uniref:Uncharacterized membrane protein YcaP, DUF421 family n=1 Tax=Mesobacillus persicus TaxID=930146 RepID=A0A1H7VNK3_9BACI|nr:DUF421 domain-containing protein [Mesobacillus persicus]SEM10425.1 Uncharacterized membrane protein YcaP, DUF421 family [Mesobacillus persicus]